MKISDCKPCGHQVLLELLTTQEMLGTKLIVNEQKNIREFQAIVLAMGPSIKDEHGFKVGDRVLLSGSGVPVPNYDNNDRDKILMEPHCIKAVLLDTK
jgi:co-chaperonin GroES (HSP10)